MFCWHNTTCAIRTFMSPVTRHHYCLIETDRYRVINMMLAKIIAWGKQFNLRTMV